jgi:hypothetical protein
MLLGEQLQQIQRLARCKRRQGTIGLVCVVLVGIAPLGERAGVGGQEPLEAQHPAGGAK